jgi:anti-sigma B factor antagonist
VSDLDVAVVTTHPELVACLERLWIQADSPSYRVLEKGSNSRGGKLPGTGLERVRLGRSAIGEMLNGPEGPVPAEEQDEEVWGLTGKLTLRVRRGPDYAIVTAYGEIDECTAPQLRELLIDLVNKKKYQIIVNVDEADFLDTNALGVLTGGLKRLQQHDGSLDLVCTQERLLKILRISGLTKVFDIHETVDQAIMAKKGR